MKILIAEEKFNRQSKSPSADKLLLHLAALGVA